MSGWWDSVKSSLKNAYCEVSDFSVWFTGNVADALDETKYDDLGELQRDLFAYWNKIACGGNPETEFPAALEPPFFGGQCTGNVQYLVTAQVDERTSAGGFVRTITNTVFGVGVVRGAFLVASNKGAVVRFGDTLPYTQGTIAVLGSTSNVLANPRITKIVRNDGKPDTCGDPPAAGITPSGQPLSVTRDITYTDESGVSATATAVQFTYGLPIIEPDGTVSIPYEVCYDNFCFKGRTNFGGDLVEVRPEPPYQDAIPPNQEVGNPIGDGTETPEPSLNGEALPPAEKLKKPILGVFIRSQKTGNTRRASEIFLGDYAPAILVPNIGFVRFRVYVGEEDGWLPDIPIKNVSAYVPVPDKLEAVEVAVEWQQGWKGKYLINRGKHCCSDCEDD